MFKGRMSWRRLRVLLDHLPLDSAYRTAIWNRADASDMAPPVPGVFGPWSQAELLLARVGDAVNQLIWMQADPKSRPAQPPPPYPRPGVEAKVRPISAEAAAYLEFKRTHQGADPPEGWEPALG